MYANEYISDTMKNSLKIQSIELDPAETNILKSKIDSLYLLPTIIFQLASKGLIKISPKPDEINLIIEIIKDEIDDSLSPWEKETFKGLIVVSLIKDTKMLDFIETIDHLEKLEVKKRIYNQLITSLMNKGLITKRRAIVRIMHLFLNFSLILPLVYLWLRILEMLGENTEFYINPILYFLSISISGIITIESIRYTERLLYSTPKLKRTKEGESVYQEVRKHIMYMKTELIKKMAISRLDTEKASNRENLTAITWLTAMEDKKFLEEYFKIYGETIAILIRKSLGPPL